MLTALEMRLSSISGYVMGLLLMLLLSAALPLQAADSAKVQVNPIQVPNPATDLWREVRQRNAVSQGNTQVRGTDTEQLILASGEEFRDYRLDYLIPYASYAIAGVLILLLAVYIVKGRIKIEGGESGQRIKRYSDYERVLHWNMAILFIFLAITGLILLLGRSVILPLFGHEAFSVIASLCKEGHNLFGPLFLVAIVLFFLSFAVRNIPKAVDFIWVLKGGGIIGGHASAGYFNAGEKIWFWLLMAGGLMLCTTGIMLIFPNFEQGRDLMQIALVLHGIGALILIVVSFGHMYIGSIGMEGSLDAMTSGHVDANWVKHHHDLWYDEVIEQSSKNNNQT
jgi:formate dehydrogenase subunit gamma